MSEHTPQHHTPTRVNPDHSGADPTLTDLVAGDPPVPITVWRTARTSADTGRTVGARLAYRLVAAYSRPGDTVVDCTDDHALTTACLAGRRRHHPGWFTDGPSLLIGPASEPADPNPSDEQQQFDDGDVPEVSAWFGDDLTDPADPAGSPQATGLLVASWPLDANEGANRVRLACLLTACARLLRPGGCLVLIVAVPAGTIATPQDFSPLATAAANVGLGYLQHIVAVTADTDADTFVYHVTDEELLALAEEMAGQQWTLMHHRVHADLLVFSPPPATPPQRRRRREGGDRRG
jgi:SAM-dependent methyltransferase